MERAKKGLGSVTENEALDKAALEVEIKNLLEDVVDSKTPEERKQADQSLEIARTKLMEVLTNQNLR